jgi:hypothetical protein
MSNWGKVTASSRVMMMLSLQGLALVSAAFCWLVRLAAHSCAICCCGLLSFPHRKRRTFTASTVPSWSHGMGLPWSHSLTAATWVPHWTGTA